jgi:hypothetical protein
MAPTHMAGVCSREAVVDVPRVDQGTGKSRICYDGDDACVIMVQAQKVLDASVGRCMPLTRACQLPLTHAASHLPL